MPLSRFLQSSLFIALLSSLALVNLANADSAQALSYELLNTYQHNSGNWTQGLFFHEGILYEGTGQNGDSRLVRYRDDYENPAYTRTLPARYFGEGIAVHQGLMYQLTWKSGTGFIYDPNDLSRKGDFNYEGEGWGITSSGEDLWMSNGSINLLKISPEGEVLQSLAVIFNGEPLDKWNELEWINGKIFANRWYDNHIYIIDPESGEVTNYIDLSELAEPFQSDPNKVLNGVAWHAERQTLWITGKYWDELYELKIQNL